VRAEAKAILDEELKRARLGVVHQPNRTLRELVDAFLEHYDAAPSSVVWIRTNAASAVERDVARAADRRVAGDAVGSEGYRAHRALRQVLEAAVRWGRVCGPRRRSGWSGVTSILPAGR